jgi:hypothetical protein
MTGIPLFALSLTYIIFTIIFPDRWNYLAGFALSSILWLASRSIGRKVFSRNLSIADSWMFPAGLGIILGIATIITSFSTAHWLLTTLWILLAIAACFELSYLKIRVPLKFSFFAPLIAVAFLSSVTPTIFFDALSYHLGLPYQYLEFGKMRVLNHQLYSTFPPFEQVLNLMFVRFELLSGIKLFSLILYLGLIHVITEFLPTKEDSNVDPKFICWILALFPAPWILIHLITADLLASLFFCCGVAIVVRFASAPNSTPTFLPALLFSCAIWTKINCLLYTALIPVLWFLLAKHETFSEKVKQIALQAALVFLLLLPLLIRNFVAVGDPLYPALKNIIPKSSWSIEQQRALKIDSFSRRENLALSIIKTPVLLTFRKGSFGAAAEPGLVFLFGVLMYFFLRKNSLVNKILIYVLVCYLLWISIFFSFRQFIPVFFLLSLPSAIAIEEIHKRSRLLFYVCIAVFAVYSVLGLFPIFRILFPFINPGQTKTNYLTTKLDYYSAATEINALHTSGKILFLGESRSAYIKHPSIVPSRYDKNPMFDWTAQSKDSEALFTRFKQEGVQFIFCNWKEYAHLAGKTGLLPIDILPRTFLSALPQDGIAASGNKIAKLNNHDREILREFLSKHVVPVWQSSGTFYFYEIRSSK